MALTEAQMKKMVMSFTGANESTSYGQPSFKIENKFFTRLRAEDNSLVLIVDTMDERDMLLEAEPKLFHITPHYKDYPSVLARMEYLDTKTLRGFLERRWRKIASKKLQKQAAGTDEKHTLLLREGRTNERQRLRSGRGKRKD
jgi:hypothetical protein